MIFDQIINADRYKVLSKNLEIAFNFLMESELESFPPGTIPILDDKVFGRVSEYNTKDPNEIDWEAHQKYIDIQCLIFGQEKIGHAPINSMKLIKDYNIEKDIAFYQGYGDYVTLKPGSFALFYPYDSHKPGLVYFKSILVKKLVIKVLDE